MRRAMVPVPLEKALENLKGFSFMMMYLLLLLGLQLVVSIV